MFTMTMSLREAYKEAMEEGRGDVKEVIIEEFIDFDREFTLLTVTQKNGPTLFCPPIGHVQKGGDYRESWMPCTLSNEALATAQDMADKVTRALTGYGIWGVEFFLSRSGEVIFSEPESASARHRHGDAVPLHKPKRV